ncbi:hypothetical protein OUZ56_015675 [Daphnia magna]|uniref:Uncharacterized protein n=1 Tax=Daphnia magna TaxID=35525 RepID=A0ABR0ANE6_9CRUS|nr:hypothetical protein OUZ56_015675 [Daphnia magna]
MSGWGVYERGGGGGKLGFESIACPARGRITGTGRAVLHTRALFCFSSLVALKSKKGGINVKTFDLGAFPGRDGLKIVRKPGAELFFLLLFFR